MLLKSTIHVTVTDLQDYKHVSCNIFARNSLLNITQMRFTCALLSASQVSTCAAILHKLFPLCVDKRNILLLPTSPALRAMLLFISHSQYFLLLVMTNGFVETAVRHVSSFIVSAKDGLFISTNCPWLVRVSQDTNVYKYPPPNTTVIENIHEFQFSTTENGNTVSVQISEVRMTRTAFKSGR